MNTISNTTASITPQPNTTASITPQQGQKRPRNSTNIEASKIYCSKQLATSTVPFNNRDLAFKTDDIVKHIFYYLFRKGESENDPGMTKLKDLRNLFAFARSTQCFYSMALAYMKTLAYYYYNNFDLFHQKCLNVCDFEDGIKILLIKNLDETDNIKYLIKLAHNFSSQLSTFIFHKEYNNNDQDYNEKILCTIKTLNTIIILQRSLSIEILSFLYTEKNINHKNESEYYFYRAFCELVNGKCIDYNNKNELCYVTKFMEGIEKYLDDEESLEIFKGLVILNARDWLGKMPIDIIQNILNKLAILLGHNNSDVVYDTISIINFINSEKSFNNKNNPCLIKILEKLKNILDNSTNLDILCVTVAAFSHFANTELLNEKKYFQPIEDIMNRLLCLQLNELDLVKQILKTFGDFAAANLIDKKNNKEVVSQQINTIANKLTIFLSSPARFNELICDTIKTTTQFIKAGLLDKTTHNSLIRSSIHNLENLLENTENLELVCNTIEIIGQFAKLRDFLYLKSDSQLIENIVNKLELLLNHIDKTIVHNTIKTLTQFVKAGFLNEIEEFKLFNNIKNKLKIFLDDEELQLISKNAIETIESALDQIEDEAFI